MLHKDSAAVAYTRSSPGNPLPSYKYLLRLPLCFPYPGANYPSAYQTLYLTHIHYPIAPHNQECYVNEVWNKPQLSLPITEKIANEELSLPIGPSIPIENVAEVVKLINDFK